MKKRIAVCLIFALALGLCACGQESAGRDRLHTRHDREESASESTQGSSQDVPQSTTKEPIDDEPEKTTTEAAQPDEPAPDEPAPEDPGYLQRIERPDQSIYAGPGYDYGFVGVVEMAATYTIVEEMWDDEGNLWGKLKSGAGWVDLTEVQVRNEAKELVSANYADKTLLKSGKYHEFILEESEYLEKLAFRSYENVTDVQFRWLLWEEEGLQVDKVLHTIPELKAGEAFVAGVVFYGDMTMFGLSFVDGNGVTHYYSVSVSGRNGSLVFEEYQP